MFLWGHGPDNHSHNSGPTMCTYSNQDFERIAAAIGKGPAHVIQYANRFEAAAAWYRLYCRAPKGVHPADTGKRMRQIANAAHKLLRHLEIYDYRKAPDGPADVTLLEFLASAENGGEDVVIHATAQIGCLAEIFATIDAARGLERHGRKAVKDAEQLSRLISIKGRRGDHAVNVWLAEMMSTYKALTQSDPRISVVSSGPNRGEPSGPFLSRGLARSWLADAPRRARAQARRARRYGRGQRERARPQ